MKNLIVAQSGGPTAAINATLAGVIKEWLGKNDGAKVYGSRFGVEGILNEKTQKNKCNENVRPSAHSL